VEVVLASEDLGGIREEELEILKDLGVEINLETSETDHPVAVEGLIGYRLKGDPRPPFNRMIKEINEYETVVSVDIASGLDPDTGEEAEPCVRPDFTVTLAAPFEGMAEENSGRVFIADIGVPPEAFERFGFTGDFFSERSLVEVDL
jgi:NAD(P)H-hydrate epimerase